MVGIVSVLLNHLDNTLSCWSVIVCFVLERQGVLPKQVMKRGSGVIDAGVVLHDARD